MPRVAGGCLLVLHTRYREMPLTLKCPYVNDCQYLTKPLPPFVSVCQHLSPALHSNSEIFECLFDEFVLLPLFTVLYLVSQKIVYVYRYSILERTSTIQERRQVSLFSAPAPCHIFPCSSYLGSKGAMTKLAPGGQHSCRGEDNLQPLAVPC